MDYFKSIAEMQKQFKENPRQGIIKFLNSEDGSAQRLPPLDLKRLYLFKQIHKEYAGIIGQLIKKRMLNLEQLFNHNALVSNMQRMDEQRETIIAYTKEANAITALRLSRAYASSMEIIWQRLKQVILFAGLNKKEGHITLSTLLDKLKHIEKEYNLNLITTKNYVDSELRNFIGHEKTVLNSSNQIIFLDINAKEVKKITTEGLYGLLFDALVILGAFASVDNAVLASRIALYLPLTDDELNQFMATGILTDTMRKKIESG